MTTDSKSLHAVVTAHVTAQHPRSLLALGPAARALLPASASPGTEPPRVRVLARPRGVTELDSGEHVDLALVAGLLESYDKREAEMLIARLRDLHARRMLVVIDAERASERGWDERQLFALGLVRVQHVIENERRYDLFGFDIRRYKVTPDWLNARFWANPELWDKFRW